MSEAVAVLVMFSFATPSPSFAFRTGSDLPEFESESERPIRWSRFAFRYESPSDPELAEVASWAGSVWSSVPCSAAEVSAVGASMSGVISGDGRNQIGIIYSGWSDRGFDSGAGATTDVRYGSTGAGFRIIEADIYLNGEEYDFALSPTGDQRSLHATVLHEMGHALGLLHPCEPDGADGAPLCSSDYIDSVVYPLQVNPV